VLCLVLAEARGAIIPGHKVASSARTPNRQSGQPSGRQTGRPGPEQEGCLRPRQHRQGGRRGAWTQRPGHQGARLPALDPPRPWSVPGIWRYARLQANTHLDGLSLASRLPSTTAGTQLVSSVQSACSPQLQPVENLEKSQVSRLPGRWQVHFF
jgi:hypothetical protein